MKENTQNIQIQKNSPESFQERKKSIDALKTSFLNFFSVIGYKRIKSFDISSGEDPTVRFIGSHISVMKPWLINKNIPSEGIMMTQDCMRVKGLDSLFDDNTSEYGSFFTSIGTLSRVENLSDVCKNLILFLQSLGIKKEEIQINISSKDTDLIDVVFDLGIIINTDTKPESYYKHKVGLENIEGRNFNFSIKNKKTENFSDVGNVILLEDKEGGVAVEVAIGTSVLIKQIEGLERVQDSYPVKGLENVPNLLRYKLEDSILVSLILLNEGLRPFGSDNKNRILKRYIKAMLYLIKKSDLELSLIKDITNSFERELLENDSGNNTEILFTFLDTYLREIYTKKDSELSKDDRLIKNLIK